MEIENKEIDEYPVRYKAFENEGIIWINSNPIKRGGNELAIYHSSLKSKTCELDNYIHCSISSYQDKYLLLECRGENRDLAHYSQGTMSMIREYDYDKFHTALNAMEEWIIENQDYIKLYTKRRK